MDQKTPKDELPSSRRGRAPRKMRAQALYQQVDNTIRQRLIDNVWKPGEAIPSEMQLAAEMNVSQGTVRKALNDLVAENLLYRRQGLGTFVSEHTERRALFLFFSIVGDDGPVAAGKPRPRLRRRHGHADGGRAAATGAR